MYQIHKLKIIHYLSTNKEFSFHKKAVIAKRPLPNIKKNDVNITLVLNLQLKHQLE